MQPVESIADALEEISHSLRRMKQAGLGGFDCPQEVLERLNRWGKTLPGGREALEGVGQDLGDCRRCKLAQDRRHIVFGEGLSSARLVFVGEGPGVDEDRTGKPFVGAAGQLLTKIIAAMNLHREQVYICNIVKCRPPNNRTPEPDEIGACFPFLKRQIRAIGPEFVCALGAVAARTLLETDQPMSRLRGHFHGWMGIRVMPTYHPAYLLRHPEKKREVWEDVQKLMRAMGEGAVK